MLDTTAWISVLGLLDECPVLPAALTAVLEGPHHDRQPDASSTSSPRPPRSATFASSCGSSPTSVRLNEFVRAAVGARGSTRRSGIHSETHRVDRDARRSS